MVSGVIAASCLLAQVVKPLPKEPLPMEPGELTVPPGTSR